jgi:hypothetical protein
VNRERRGFQQRLERDRIDTLDRGVLCDERGFAAGVEIGALGVRIGLLDELDEIEEASSRMVPDER